MPRTLNEIKLHNLFSELQMAYGADNESRISKLKEEIGIIQRDIALRDETGLLPGNYPSEVVR